MLKTAQHIIKGFSSFTSSSISFDHGRSSIVVGYRRDELELSFHLAMGTASEALTSLQGVACNMAILAGAAGGLSPKFDVHIAYRADPPIRNWLEVMQHLFS